MRRAALGVRREIEKLVHRLLDERRSRSARPDVSQKMLDLRIDLSPLDCELQTIHGPWSRSSGIAGAEDWGQRTARHKLAGSIRRAWQPADCCARRHRQDRPGRPAEIRMASFCRQ